MAHLNNHEELVSLYRACELCPRRCGVDRTAGRKGFCGETALLRLAAVEAHLGEEPPISGTHGSGTVFFSGCALRCRYCQNYQISHDGLGREWILEAVVDRLQGLCAARMIHNVNFVTPDHFLPHTASLVQCLRRRGIRMPAVYNLSGYQRVVSLRLIETVADIYLPDFKYADTDLAARLSNCPDYPRVALDAVAEMVRQKGFLDTFASGGDRETASPNTAKLNSPASSGVLVRHLILPGHVSNSLQVLDMLFLEFGQDIPLSLMSQYVPVRRFDPGSPLNRPVQRAEFGEVFRHARALGFRNLFVQYPEETTGGESPFLPDFLAANPFPGNRGDRTGQASSRS
jgi:putative pyruvate formate lyase activating enzyme